MVPFSLDLSVCGNLDPKIIILEQVAASVNGAVTINVVLEKAIYCIFSNFIDTLLVKVLKHGYYYSNGF